MNLLNFAVGGLSGLATNSPLTPLIGIGGALLAGQGGGSAAAAGSGATRDSLMSELPAISSSVNLLAQAASGNSAADPSSQSTSTDSSDQLTLPPLPPMPAPAKPPAVPTDDNGQSNIILQDSSSDGSFIS